MTLVQVGKNKNTIIVAADSLRGRKQQDGSPTQVFCDAKKHYKVTDSCSILVAGNGFDMAKVDDFLARFIEKMRPQGEDKVAEISKELQSALFREVVGNINPPNNLVLILAGFEGTEPQVFKFHSDRSFTREKYNTAYLAAGKEDFANAKARELGVNGEMSSEELEAALRSIHSATQTTFPDEVGGTLTIKTLGPSKIT